MGVPCYSEFFSVIFDQFRDPIQVLLIKTIAYSKANWIESEFGFSMPRMINVELNRFIVLIRIKVEPVWPNTFYRRQ